LAFNYTDDNKNYKGDGTNYNVFQEYLANASTLSDAEIESRKFALENIKVNGNPISPADIPNHNSSFNRTVEVTVNTAYQSTKTYTISGQPATAVLVLSA
ncbi:MAG: hypothetical protein K2I52_04995, partial [Muribaculaceae bacterium]|nr:hypothetical protein [Muribaculaceae bacterium]